MNSLFGAAACRLEALKLFYDVKTELHGFSSFSLKDIQFKRFSAQNVSKAARTKKTFNFLKISEIRKQKNSKKLFEENKKALKIIPILRH